MTIYFRIKFYINCNIALDKAIFNQKVVDIFLTSSRETNVVGSDLKHLFEALIMSTHNIQSFSGKNNKKTNVYQML